MRDLINNDIDIHGFMGSTIKGLFKGIPPFDVRDPEIVSMYTGIIKNFKKESPKEYKSLRQLAKALDFGLPGGLGPRSFSSYAKNYGVELTVEEAIPLCKLWKDTFPETRLYLENPGPELDELAPKALPTDDEKTRRFKQTYRYKCVNLLGRKRARCSYTQATNTGFQSLASDSTKLAMWNLYKAGYPMTNMIHDETITLIPFDPLLTNRAANIQYIMESSMRQLTPDVKVKAEPALMFRWAKSAEPYFFKGNLIPWEIVPKKKEIKNGEVKISPIEEPDLTLAQSQELSDTIERLYEICGKARENNLNKQL